MSPAMRKHTVVATAEIIIMTCLRNRSISDPNGTPSTAMPSM